jgi:F-type H+-transporting ATPase subunit b
MLSIEPGLLIWTIITFVILLIVLRKVAWKPLLTALEQRESTIRNSLDEAQKARQESEQLLAENRRILANANRESARILEQGREEANVFGPQLLSKRMLSRSVWLMKPVEKLPAKGNLLCRK